MIEKKYTNKPPLEPPPLPLTHPPPFGSATQPRSPPMKFTTFHQHQQHVPANGNYNESNFQTVQINTTQHQQHYMVPQSHHHHQQQQYSMPPNYMTNNVITKMNQPQQIPFVPQQHQQHQRSSAIWHQQYTSTPMRHDFNGNSESG